METTPVLTNAKDNNYCQKNDTNCKNSATMYYNDGKQPSKHEVSGTEQQSNAKLSGNILLIYTN